MRLLVVTQYFWPEDFRINELVSGLIARGHEITVLTGQPNYPQGTLFPDFQSDPVKFSRYHGACIIRVPMLLRGKGSLRLLLNYVSYAVSATVFGLWRLRHETYDAIFVFEPSPVTVGIPAVVLRAFKRWPIAFWVLDQWPETLSAVGVVTSQPLMALVGKLVAFIYTRCDAVLSPSKSLARQIARYCAPHMPVTYFPNWAESAYGDRSAVLAMEVPEKVGAFNVLFAGNIGESQNFPAILDAAEQLKQHDHIRWLIVGDGRMAGWVSEEITRRGLQGCFILLGRYPIDRMPSFYAHADALLVSLKPDPIFSMMIPGKIQSYLAYGLPILGMLDGEGASVITEANAGLTCPPDDATQLAAAVLHLAEMPVQERAQLGANGSAYARREFDKDMLVGRLEQLLERIAQHARAGIRTGAHA